MEGNDERFTDVVYIFIKDLKLITFIKCHGRTFDFKEMNFKTSLQPHIIIYN